MPMSDLMQMAAHMGGGYGGRGRLSSLLAQMPDSNNGSTLGGIGSVLQKALLGYQMGQEQAALQDTMSQAAQALQPRPGAQDAPGPVPMQGDSGFVSGGKDPMSSGVYSAGFDMAPKAPDTKLAASLLLQNPETRGMGFQMTQQNMAYDAQKQRADEERAQRAADRAQNHQWALEDRTAQQGFQEKMFGMQSQQAREMARLAAGLRAPQDPIVVTGPDGKPTYVSPADAIGKQPYDSKRVGIIGMTPEGQPIMGDPSKPQMPAAALKMQQEELDAMGAAASMRANLAGVNKMLEGGQLSLSPMANLESKARNAVGMSDDNSRNYASLMSSLEKMRNESLRLNKGVQTEGDAARAWNELISNVNNPGVVKQRLKEIDILNQRAAGLRQNNIDIIRRNYGLPSLDTSSYQNLPSAVGGGLTQSEADELAALRARFGK